MKKLVIVIVLALSILSLSSCFSPQPASNLGKWSIVQSPTTGRYYEMVTIFAGSSAGMMSMSEVAKAEYDNFVAAQNKK